MDDVVIKESPIQSIQEQERESAERNARNPGKYWEASIPCLHDEIAPHECTGQLCLICLQFVAAWNRLKADLGA